MTQLNVSPSDDEGVRVRVHPSVCEGWGNCHRFAPTVYPIDDQGYIDLHLLHVPPELSADAWLGADACPARAITIAGRRPERHR